MNKSWAPGMLIVGSFNGAFDAINNDGRIETMAFRLGVSIARGGSAAATEHGDARRARLEGEVVALFDRFRDQMLRYLSTFGLSASDGEEVIQEVFLALFRHLDLDKPRNNLDAWLFRVAHNLALKRRDRIRRRLRVMSDTGLSDDCAIDPSPTAEEALVHVQTQERLRSVLKLLPEQDRRCLALRAEGLRYREIAEVMDISLGGVSVSLARSLARLARAAER